MRSATDSLCYCRRIAAHQNEPVNPLASSANRCFVCGKGNPIGLNVRFRLDGDVCRAEFTPGEVHVGYDGVTHGGILFSLLDDVMANYVFLGGERCYTAKAEVRYRGPLPIGTAVKLEGRQVRRKGRLVVLEGRVLRADDGEVVAEATGSFMVEAAAGSRRNRESETGRIHSSVAVHLHSSR